MLSAAHGAWRMAVALAGCCSHDWVLYSMAEPKRYACCTPALGLSTGGSAAGLIDGWTVPRKPPAAAGAEARVAPHHAAVTSSSPAIIVLTHAQRAVGSVEMMGRRAAARRARPDGRRAGADARARWWPVVAGGAALRMSRAIGLQQRRSADQALGPHFAGAGTARARGKISTVERKHAGGAKEQPMQA